ncbi:MAG: hypothetical protein P8J91_15020 [Pirellulaceae bacterium]|nr:hypothetical protein [Pirellulaceae bacterium]MDG2105059.1 hypothetical protein [Pirellulaceae bacterium]
MSKKSEWKDVSARAGEVALSVQQETLAKSIDICHNEIYQAISF